LSKTWSLKGERKLQGKKRGGKDGEPVEGKSLAFGGNLFKYDEDARIWGSPVKVN